MFYYSHKALGERTGTAIVVVRHLNKSTSANPLYRGGGSIGIIGAARCGLLLAQDPEHPQRRILAATKGNLGRPPPSLAFYLEPVPALGVARVVWDEETPWTAEALLRATAEGEVGRSALGEARAWLRQVLADGPRAASELLAEARTMGIGVRTYHAARKAEGVIARKEQTLHGGWILTLRSVTWKTARSMPLVAFATFATFGCVTRRLDYRPHFPSVASVARPRREELRRSPVYVAGVSRVIVR